MAWVRGIREVRYVTVSVEGKGVAILRGEHLGVRRGPILTRQERVCVELPADAVARVVHGRAMRFLPEHKGAGPCGTWTRAACGARMLWSIEHLLAPLAEYYASYEPPIRLGAKGTPRGRRAA